MKNKMKANLQNEGTLHEFDPKQKLNYLCEFEDYIKWAPRELLPSFEKNRHPSQLPPQIGAFAPAGFVPGSVAPWLRCDRNLGQTLLIPPNYEDL